MENVSSSNGLEKRPKLRFPGFDEPWKAEKLSDFAERVTRKNTNNETSLPLTISSKDGLVDQISYFNKTVASKDMSGYYLLKNGEYAYNKSYSVGYDFGSVKRLDRYDMGALSTLYICFALKKHDSDFIKAYFDSLKWYREIYMISAEGARNHGLLNVPTDEFFDTKHYIPMDLAEQRKIANFMIALERRIVAQQSLVDNLKKYKRGVVSKVFSEIERECSTIRLGDYVSIHRGGSPRPIDAYITDDTDGINWIKIGDTSADDLYITRTREKIVPSGAKKSRRVFQGDLILSNSMSFGRPYILQIDGCIHDGWLLIRDENNVFEKRFLCYYLGSDNVIAQYKRFAAGSCVNNLNSELVGNVEICCPPYRTQQKIANMLTVLDSRIDHVSRTHVALLRIRTSFLQQLFI
jgi:type I restriction enzyme S subunit